MSWLSPRPAASRRLAPLPGTVHPAPASGPTTCAAAAQPQKAARLRAAPPDGLSHLWRKSDPSMTQARLAEMRILLMGFTCDDQASFRRDLRGLGAAVVASCPSAEQLSDVARMRLEFDCVVLNFDSFGSVEDGIDTLMEFRMQRPAATVVMVTRGVLGDDLGAERRAICDATLRAPVTSDRLRAALLGASDNHAHSLPHRA